MTATDVSDTLTIALRSSGLERVRVQQRPRLLSDNGPSYLSAQHGSWLTEHGMTHTRGKPYHPMTQGKIERYHRSMKNRALLEHYYLPGQLEARLAEFVDYYNTRRYHESLHNLTPAAVYFSRGHPMLKRRETIRRKTIELRRHLHHLATASTSTPGKIRRSWFCDCSREPFVIGCRDTSSLLLNPSPRVWKLPNRWRRDRGLRVATPGSRSRNRSSA
jgi:putative transposase